MVQPDFELLQLCCTVLRHFALSQARLMLRSLVFASFPDCDGLELCCPVVRVWEGACVRMRAHA